jgi:anti-sigma factor RsiW
MSCSSFDLKEYFFGEAPADERRRVETHLEACAECRDELARLQLTQASLAALREEELPRRIAFVSDKVFEPRWYQRLWNSSARLAFAASALLACAILVHAFVRPSPAPVLAKADAARIEARVQQEVATRVNSAVTRAVAQVQQRDDARFAEFLKAADRRFAAQERTIQAAYDDSSRSQQLLADVYRDTSGLRQQ